jgi:thioredoxin reductase
MTASQSTEPGSTETTVIIIGLGIGGLTAAISCHLKGHHVIGFDKLENLEPYGELGLLRPDHENRERLTKPPPPK